MIRIHQSRLSAFAGLAVAVFTLTARGDFLTDAQLWFDPATIQQDYYPQVRLSSPTHSWVAAGDPIIDFDVLPLLKQGTYTSGYVYQQSDYFQRPNIDYSADLTAGTVTATFTRAGMYHVRITRQSGAIETVAVFNRSGPLGDDGPHKTGAARVVISPDGDLFLVANEPGDEALSNAAGIINDEGYDWDVMNNKADIAAKARAKALELGRPIHLELVGHGREGSIRLGPDGAGDFNRLNVDTPAKAAELLAFQESIDQYVDKLTFVSCSTGAGAEGDAFLDILGSSIRSVLAWNRSIYPVYDGNDKYFYVLADGSRIPAPATMTLLVLAGGVACRRRRG